MASVAGVAGVAGLITACVFPAYNATGIEFSWIFVESNDVEGEAGARARTCVGAGVRDVNITLTDLNDEKRTRTFPHDCDEGYQSVEEFQLTPSDVFVPLNPGEYRVSTEAFSGAGVALIREEQDIAVSARGVTVLAQDLPIPVTDWAIDIDGESSCNTLALTLVYSGADTSLSEPSADTDDQGMDVVYRAGLVSDTGLSLGGEPVNCSDAGGVHTIPQVDLGEYRLLVDVDGTTCGLATRIDRPELTLNVDLENLPCAS